MAALGGLGKLQKSEPETNDDLDQPRRSGKERKRTKTTLGGDMSTDNVF